jgi:hypothetical protein
LFGGPILAALQLDDAAVSPPAWGLMISIPGFRSVSPALPHPARRAVNLWAPSKIDSLPSCERQIASDHIDSAGGAWGEAALGGRT